jgi:hypothetical protein
MDAGTLWVGAAAAVCWDPRKGGQTPAYLGCPRIAIIHLARIAASKRSVFEIPHVVGPANEGDRRWNGVDGSIGTLSAD